MTILTVYATVIGLLAAVTAGSAVVRLDRALKANAILRRDLQSARVDLKAASASNEELLIERQLLLNEVQILTAVVDAQADLIAEQNGMIDDMMASTVSDDDMVNWAITRIVLPEYRLN